MYSWKNPLQSYTQITIQKFGDGQPCSPNCERHISHPCEKCGRIEARGTVTLPLDEKAKKRLKLNLKLYKIKNRIE